VARTQNNLAKIYLAQGKVEEAVKRFETAIATNPNNLGAYLTLAHLHMEAKQPEEAKMVYDRALAQFPNLWIAANNLAYLKSEYPRSADDLQKALELAKKAYQLRPKEANTADTLGWIYYKMGDPKSSLPLLEEAVSRVPQGAVFNYHLGWSVTARGTRKKPGRASRRPSRAARILSAGKRRSKLFSNCLEGFLLLEEASPWPENTRSRQRKKRFSSSAP